MGFECRWLLVVTGLGALADRVRAQRPTLRPARIRSLAGFAENDRISGPTGGVVDDSFRLAAVPFDMMRFADVTPALVRAINATPEKAVAANRDDLVGASADYFSISGDCVAAENLAALLRKLNKLLGISPGGTPIFARSPHHIGTLRNQPAAWTGYVMPAAAGLGIS